MFCIELESFDLLLDLYEQQFSEGLKILNICSLDSLYEL